MRIFQFVVGKNWRLGTSDGGVKEKSSLSFTTKEMP